MLRALARRHDVTNIAVARAPRERDDAEALARIGIAVTPVLVPRPDASLPAFRLTKWVSIAIGRSSLPRRWFHRGFADVVRANVLTKPPDLTILETSWMDVYRPAIGGRPFIASTQNIESDILAETANGRASIARIVAGRDARLLARAESRYFAEARVAIAVSNDDAARIRTLAPGARPEVVENGVDLDRLGRLPGNDATGPLLFVGSFDYDANVDAVRHLVTDLLPAIRRRAPDTAAIVAGRSPGREVHALAQAQGVEVAATVPDLTPLYARAGVVVVPLRIGGGSRIKILEALALGRPVVTTTIGMRGLDLADGVEVLVADTPEAFATAIQRLRDDGALRERLVAAGRAFVERRHAWSDLEARFAQIISEAGARA